MNLGKNRGGNKENIWCQAFLELESGGVLSPQRGQGHSWNNFLKIQNSAIKTK